MVVSEVMGRVIVFSGLLGARKGPAPARGLRRRGGPLVVLLDVVGRDAVASGGTILALEAAGPAGAAETGTPFIVADGR